MVGFFFIFCLKRILYVFQVIRSENNFAHMLLVEHLSQAFAFFGCQLEICWRGGKKFSMFFGPHKSQVGSEQGRKKEGHPMLSLFNQPVLTAVTRPPFSFYLRRLNDGQHRQRRRTVLPLSSPTPHLSSSSPSSTPPSLLAQWWQHHLLIELAPPCP